MNAVRAASVQFGKYNLRQQKVAGFKENKGMSKENKQRRVA